MRKYVFQARKIVAWSYEEFLNQCRCELTSREGKLIMVNRMTPAEFASKYGNTDITHGSMRRYLEESIKRLNKNLLMSQPEYEELRQNMSVLINKMDEHAKNVLAITRLARTLVNDTS